MILLSGHSLTQARRVPVESMSLHLKERENTAELVPADMSGIGQQSWLLDDINPGKGIVWRVKSIRQDYGNDTPTVTLEHVINTLRDRILFGEITPATITGTEGADTCSAESAVRYILARQGDWQLGSFGYSQTGAYKFDGDSLYSALEKVTETLEDAWWSYDLSKYPFKLNITKKPDGVTCELRPGRNLVTITKTVDKTGMYTRFYPIGKDDLHISGDYVSRNEDKYGVVSKVEVDQSRTTEAELREWADERLKRHAHPLVSVTADGLELADATGESLDRLNLGRMCRIPLKDFGTTIEERIVELEYRDKVHEPERVQITMANAQEDIARLIADEIRNGAGPSGGGGRGAARQQKEDHAWFEDTETYVAMCAEGIVGKDADGNPDWARLSQIIVDGEGIHQSVQVIKEGNVIRDTKIEQNDRRITLEAERAISEEGKLSSQITVQADKISLEVKNRENQYKSLSSRIDVQANKISLVVTEKNGRYTVNTAQIVAGINGDHGSYIKLQADTINLSGYVTMSDLAATNATIANLTSGVTQMILLNCYNIDWRGNRLVSKTITINGTQYHLMGY